MALLWLSIAKNEIRLWTSQFRNHRRLLFIIIAAIMGIYALVLVPLILSPFHDAIYGLLDDLNSIGLLSFVIFFVFALVGLITFFWCISYPLSATVQDTSDLSGKLEVLLSSPIKPQDILLGKFLGRFPTILIMILAIFPWLVNFFGIRIPISPFAQLAIYMVIFLGVVLGLWLGTLFAAYIESWIRKSARKRDIGRSLSFVIAIVFVIFMYILIYGLISFDPSSPLFNVLHFFPSTWGAHIIMSALGLSPVLPINPIIFTLLLISVTLLGLYLGYRAAERFYSLEPVAIEAQTIRSENFFFRFVRRLFPGTFGVQILSQLKQFSRKYENFTRLGYAVGISITIFVFNPNMWTVGDPFFSIGFKIMMTVFMFAMMTSIILGAFVIVGSKDNLWIYRKAPNGVKKFVWSVFFVNIIYSVIIGIIYSIIFSVIAGFTIVDSFIMVLFSIGFQLALMAVAIGMSFIFPTFEERGGKIGLIVMGTMGIAMAGFFVAIVANIFLANFIGGFVAPLCALVLIAVMGYGLIHLGIHKLSSLE
ncbi:MAG: hypothetical protein EU536_03825 [Promethearchaeota archaeon]|nr:MAG: hypothetical protein EU536_03825 [Candidatus Lokiarchaeota archaeon]